MGAKVVVIATAESPHSVRMTSKVGNRRYVPDNDRPGKAPLATMPDLAVTWLTSDEGPATDD